MPKSLKDHNILDYSKTCRKQPLSKRPKIDFQAQLSLNAGQKYCRMLQWEHSAILLTFIKLPFVIQIFVLSIFEWPLKTGFTVVVLVTHKDLYTVYELEEKSMILIAQVSSEGSDQPVQMLECLHCSHTQSMVVNRSVE